MRLFLSMFILIVLEQVRDLAFEYTTQQFNFARFYFFYSSESKSHLCVYNSNLCIFAVYSEICFVVSLILLCEILTYSITPQKILFHIIIKIIRPILLNSI